MTVAVTHLSLVYGTLRRDSSHLSDYLISGLFLLAASVCLVVFWLYLAASNYVSGYPDYFPDYELTAAGVMTMLGPGG